MAKFKIFCINALFLRLIVAEVPSYISVCGRRNPKFNECVKNSIETMRPKLISGIPELNIPSIEPLVIEDTLNLLADVQGLKVIASNVKIYGLSKFKLPYLHYDVENHYVNISVHVNKIMAHGNFEISTRIMVPIEGKGVVKSQIDNSEIITMLKFTMRNTKKGPEMYFTSIFAKLNIQDSYSEFISHNTSNSALDDAINAIINTNRQEIFSSLTSILEKVIANKFIKIANGIFKTYTYNELIPDRQ